MQEGVEIIEVFNGKMTMKIVPTRGMNILNVESGDVFLGWDSPVKQVVHPKFVNLEDNGGFTTINVSYASTRRGVAHHAAALRRIMANLHHVEDINVVAYSLGNLVVRHYLADQKYAKHGLRPNRRIHRIVMLAPPNNGAILAERFGRGPLYKLIGGKSGTELGEGWSQLEKRLAIPQCEFGIVAGGNGTDLGFNPLLPGDNDFTVTVKETWLPGAKDFLVVPATHRSMIQNRFVHQYTLRFIQRGHFLLRDYSQTLSTAPIQPRVDSVATSMDFRSTEPRR